MKLNVSKSRLKGTVRIPASKSHTIRAVVIASLADGQSTIHNPLVSSDTQATVDCYRALGAEIDTTDAKRWEIVGNGGRISVPSESIDVGNSGTTLRIAMGSAALIETDKKITITGDEQVQSRPIGPLMDAFRELGAKCRSIKNNDMAPVEISGKLIGGQICIACHTSQYLSSLLLATPLAEKDSRIEVSILNEPDYVQMTLDWLDKQAIKYQNRQMRQFSIQGNQKYKAFETTIPADFSSATFFLCGGAILGEDLVIKGLDFSDSQPDKAVVDYLKQMGAQISIEPDSVRVKASTLVGAEIDMNRTPDALCAMAVTAAFAKGTTKLFNVPQARSKETDRIKSTAEELRKMSINVEELPDGLIIRHSKIKSAELDGRADHRIVMAMSLAAMAADGQSSIDTAEAVNVTFPNYVELMRSVGADIKEI